MVPDVITTPTHTIPVADGQTAQNLLVPGEIYYLVEVSAPSGYKKDNDVRTLTVEVGPDLFTKLDGATAVESSNIDDATHRPTIAYNWNQGVTLTVHKLGDNGGENQAELVNHTQHEPVTLEDSEGNERTYMLRSDASESVVTQVVIVNVVATDITIQKLSGDGDTGLSGAIFRLMAVNGHEESYLSGIDGIGTITKTIDGSTVEYRSAFETTGNVQTISGLPDGTYRLYEDYVPAGYVGTYRYIQFTLDNHVMKDVITDTGDTSLLDFTAASGNSLALLKITNTPGAALPDAGGPGTNLFQLIGAILIGFAGAGLAVRKRKRAA